MPVRCRPLIAAAVAAIVVATCTAGAMQAGADGATSPDKTAPPTAPASTTTAPLGPTTVAATAAPTTTVANTPAIADVIDVGDAKPPRFYDGYLAASLADIQQWWATEFPRLYGEPFEPLEGGIFAAYPERTDPIPGCGFPADTSYQEVSDFGAFYCPAGDFMAYDDGEDGIIYALAEEFGPSILAVVMAHEFGHAIQFRNGDLDRDIPTVYTEQQADCFSGAWSRHAWEGQASGLTFGDEDIRTGLIALVQVRDPVGPSVFDPGGHGAAFDRIGAFQEGFIGGIDNCVDLLDKPLPLLDNSFQTTNDELNQGDAQFGWSDDQIMGIVASDLQRYWPATLSGHNVTMPAVALRPSSDPRTDHCGNAQAMNALGAVYCPTAGEVVFDEALGRELYDNFGDFAPGYLIGYAWADAVQTALGSALQGEPRALASDCLVGVWVGSALQNFGVAPGTGPAGTSAAQPNHTMIVSPGDLDEAVQTSLVIGDVGLSENLHGSAFEKIAAMRRGVINGLPTCLAEIAGHRPQPGIAE